MSDSAPLYQRIPTLDDPTGEQRRATSGDGTTLNGHSTGQGAKDSFLSSTVSIGSESFDRTVCCTRTDITP